MKNEKEGTTLFVAGAISDELMCLDHGNLATLQSLLPLGFETAAIPVRIQLQMLPDLFDTAVKIWDRRVLVLPSPGSKLQRKTKAAGKSFQPLRDRCFDSWNDFSQRYEVERHGTPLVMSAEETPKWANEVLDIKYVEKLTALGEVDGLNDVIGSMSGVIYAPARRGKTFFVGTKQSWPLKTQQIFDTKSMMNSSAEQVTPEEMEDILESWLSVKRVAPLGNAGDFRLERPRQVKDLLAKGWRVDKTTAERLFINAASVQEYTQALSEFAPYVLNTLSDTMSWWDVTIRSTQGGPAKTRQIHGVYVPNRDFIYPVGSVLTKEQEDSLYWYSHDIQTVNLYGPRIVAAVPARGTSIYLGMLKIMVTCLSGIGLFPGPKGMGKSRLREKMQKLGMTVVDSDEFGDSPEFKDSVVGGKPLGKTMNDHFSDLFAAESPLAARTWLRSTLNAAEYRGIIRDVINRKFARTNVVGGAVFCHTVDEADALSEELAGRAAPPLVRDMPGDRPSFIVLSRSGLLPDRILLDPVQTELAAVYDGELHSTKFYTAADMWAALDLLSNCASREPVVGQS